MVAAAVPPTGDSRSVSALPRPQPEPQLDLGTRRLFRSHPASAARGAARSIGPRVVCSSDPGGDSDCLVRVRRIALKRLPLACPPGGQRGHRTPSLRRNRTCSNPRRGAPRRDYELELDDANAQHSSFAAWSGPDDCLIVIEERTGDGKGS